MNLQTVLKELNNIKADFLDKKLTMSEVTDCFYRIQRHSKYSFSQLYNAFYSSLPEMYLR